jgi:hypothetical protein
MKNKTTVVRVFQAGHEGDSRSPWYRTFVIHVNQFSRIVKIQGEYNWPSRAEASLWADVHMYEKPLPALYTLAPNDWRELLRVRQTSLAQI